MEESVSERPKSGAAFMDVFQTYESCVQTPKLDVVFFDMVFRKLRHRKALYLREDFCGTANISRTWVESDVQRTALGIDLDADSIRWATEKNLECGFGDRIELICANVLDPIQSEFPKADITFAFNYSVCYMKTRRDLLRYFEIAKESLNEDGIFICDLYGGVEAVKPRLCIRRVGNTKIRYTWEQELFNPITNETKCHLSFHLPDGTNYHRFMSCDWRLWTVAEVRDALLESGFKDVKVWWAKADPGFSTIEDEEKSKESHREDQDESPDVFSEPQKERGIQHRNQSRRQNTQRVKPERATQTPSEGQEDELRLVTNPPQTESWNVNIVAIV